MTGCCPKCGNADIKKFHLTATGHEQCGECGWMAEPAKHWRGDWEGPEDDPEERLRDAHWHHEIDKVRGK